MRASLVAAFVALVGLAASGCLAADAAIAKPAPCTIQCLVNPCQVTTCKPSNPAWQCEADCCTIGWTHSVTGLKVSTCPPDVCIQVYDPVCGVDGKTYGNSCTALTNGVSVAYTGPCTCTSSVKAPVCGADGVTYRNKCLATNNGTTVAYAGSCSFPTQCAKANLVYTPVCDSATGLTWANACVASLNGISAPTPDGPCIGPVCAKCLATAGCNAPHRCKGNKKYTCEIASCQVSHILDNGNRVSYGICSPVYKSKATGYPAAACFSASSSGTLY